MRSSFTSRASSWRAARLYESFLDRDAIARRFPAPSGNRSPSTRPARPGGRIDRPRSGACSAKQPSFGPRSPKPIVHWASTIRHRMLPRGDSARLERPGGLEQPRAARSRRSARHSEAADAFRRGARLAARRPDMLTPTSARPSEPSIKKTRPSTTFAARWRSTPILLPL